MRAPQIWALLLPLAGLASASGCSPATCEQGAPSAVVELVMGPALRARVSSVELILTINGERRRKVFDELGPALSDGSTSLVIELGDRLSAGPTDLVLEGRAYDGPGASGELLSAGTSHFSATADACNQPRLSLAAQTEDAGAPTQDAETDGSEPDAAEEDAGQTDAGALDAADLDANDLDAGDLDAAPDDAGTPDAGTPDAGTPDAGTPDAGTPDAGNGDAGNGDAGNGDVGNGDAGNGDAGNGDAGNGDAGNGDAGPPTYVRSGPSAFNLTPLNNPTSVVLMNDDPVEDDGQAIINLPFQFLWYGQNITFLDVNVNGIVGMGAMIAEADSWDNDAIPSASLPDSFAAVWWDDLWVDSAIPEARISYRTLGFAPNRAFVVEWRNMRHVDHNSTDAGTLTFQLRLEENGDIIRFRYGTVGVVGAPTTDPFTASAGLENDNGEGVVALPNTPNQLGVDFPENTQITFTPFP